MAVKPLGSMVSNAYKELIKQEHTSIILEIDRILNSQNTRETIINNTGEGGIYILIKLIIKYNTKNLELYCRYIRDYFISQKFRSVKVTWLKSVFDDPDSFLFHISLIWS